jgi:leucyl aminopeptidase
LERWFADRATAATIPLYQVDKKTAKDHLDGPREVKWARANGFSGQAGRLCMVPGEDGALAKVLVGRSKDAPPWQWADLPRRLPAGTYRIADALDPEAATQAALGWGLGAYSFDRYKKRDHGAVTLVWPDGADRGLVRRLGDATYLVRDLINTPAEDMGPGELETVTRDLAKKHGATITVIRGDDLLKKGYPAIHAVGRASSRAPRLIDLGWGDARAPKVTFVGKGVCFDTGGLDLKNSSGMLTMKKDMGGAAHVLGLAHAIMDAGLNLRLRVLIPAVENSVSGNAFRPLDVLSTRKGLTVEVGNTDAEGRLVLCDALAEAVRDEPAIVLDFATLTGAARVALGTDVPALFCNDDALAGELTAAGERVGDNLWRMPLWQGYKHQLDSKVADLSNVGKGPYGGAITAALFLERFVEGTPWAHVDLMAYNLESRPGRPYGGEAMGLRAFFTALAARFAPKKGKPAKKAAKKPVQQRAKKAKAR